jgi:hypothetical protein
MEATHEGRCENQIDLQACGRLNTSTNWSLTFSQRHRETPTREALKTMGSRRRIISCLLWGSSQLMEPFRNLSLRDMGIKVCRPTHYLKPNTKRVPRPKSFVLTLQASHFHCHIGGLASTNQEKPERQP